MFLARVIQYFHTKIQGKLIVLTHILETNQLRDQCSVEIVVYCSAVLNF